MTRTNLAATLSLALLSLTAVEAAAGPVTSKYTPTYTLQCSAGKTDGESLKANQTIITNTSGRVIPKGTQIKIYLSPAVRFGRIRVVTTTVYRDVYVNATIPMGDSGSSPRCSATVTLGRMLPLVATKIARR